MSKVKDRSRGSSGNCEDSGGSERSSRNPRGPHGPKGPNNSSSTRGQHGPRKRKRFFSPVSLILLAGTLLLYGLLWASGVPEVGTALTRAASILLSVLPVLAVVILFMAGTSFIPSSFVKRYLGERAGVGGYIAAAVAGTLSHGPIYVWYPFLSDLREKGVSNGKIATFLYARAVKIPLLAAMAFYFGLPFTVLFSALILIGGPLLGSLFEREK